jgi:hypothetical protein
VLIIALEKFDIGSAIKFLKLSVALVAISQKIGADPNGIKLASELLLDQLLTQCVPGFDHQGEALGPPFLDARLHSMRSDGVDDQCS